MDLLYLSYEYGENLKSKSERMEKDLFKYLRVQRLRKQIYYRQRSLLTLQLGLFKDLKDLQISASDGSIALSARVGDDIFKVYDKVAGICQLIQDSTKLLGDMVRLNGQSAFSYRCYSQFLFSFTSQYMKAVDMYLRARDIDLTVAAEVENVEVMSKSGKSQSSVSSKARSVASTGTTSSRGSSAYQLNYDDMMSDVFESTHFVFVMSGEKNDEGTVVDVYGAVEKHLEFSKSELIGLNVRRVIPTPYDQFHNDYIKRYVNYGMGAIVGKTRRLLMLDKNGYVHKVNLSIRQVVEELLDFHDERMQADGKYVDTMSDCDHTRLIFTGVVTLVDEEKQLIMFQKDGTITCFSKGCEEIWGITPNMLENKINIASLIPRLQRLVDKNSHGRDESQFSKFKFNLTIGDNTWSFQAKVSEMVEQLQTRYVEFTAEKVKTLKVLHEQESMLIDLMDESSPATVDASFVTETNSHKHTSRASSASNAQRSEPSLFPHLQQMLTASMERIESKKTRGSNVFHSERVIATDQLIEEEEPIVSPNSDDEEAMLVKQRSSESDESLPEAQKKVSEAKLATLVKQASFRNSINLDNSVAKRDDYNDKVPSRKSLRLSLLHLRRREEKSNDMIRIHSDDIRPQPEFDISGAINLTDDYHTKVCEQYMAQDTPLLQPCPDNVGASPEAAEAPKADEGQFKLEDNQAEDFVAIQSYVHSRKRMDTLLLSKIWNNMLTLFAILVLIAMVEAVSFTTLLNEIEERITRVRTAGLRRYNILNTLQPIQRVYYSKTMNLSTGAMSMDEHIAAALTANKKLVTDNTILMATGTPCQERQTLNSAECEKRERLFSTGMENAEEMITLMTLKTGVLLDCFSDYQRCAHNKNRQRDMSFILSHGVEKVIPVSNQVAEYYSVFYDDRVKSMNHDFLSMTIIPMFISLLLGYGFIYPNIRKLEYGIMNTLHNFFYLSNSQLDSLVTRAMSHIQQVNTTFQLYSFVMDSASRDNLIVTRKEEADEALKLQQENKEQGIAPTLGPQGLMPKTKRAHSVFTFEGFWKGFGIFSSKKTPPRLFKFSHLHMLFVIGFTCVFFGFNFYFASTTIRDSSR
jgi:PAS domain S-box-containing protein